MIFFLRLLTLVWIEPKWNWYPVESNTSNFSKPWVWIEPKWNWYYGTLSFLLYAHLEFELNQSGIDTNISFILLITSLSNRFELNQSGIDTTGKLERPKGRLTEQFELNQSGIDTANSNMPLLLFDSIVWIEPKWNWYFFLFWDLQKTHL